MITQQHEAFSESEPQAMAELPRYRCHKEVWALKIKSIFPVKPTIAELEALLREEPDTYRSPVGAMIHPEDEHYAPFTVDQDYVRKHNPQVGGYYVQYKDGYKSYSPAEAFDDGYTLITAGSKYTSIAELAYNAYRVASGGKSLVSGDRIPEFQYLPEAIQNAWLVAAKAVAS